MELITPNNQTGDYEWEQVFEEMAISKLANVYYTTMNVVTKYNSVVLTCGLFLNLVFAIFVAVRRFPQSIWRCYFTIALCNLLVMASYGTYFVHAIFGPLPILDQWMFSLFCKFNLYIIYACSTMSSWSWIYICYRRANALVFNPCYEFIRKLSSNDRVFYIWIAVAAVLQIWSFVSFTGQQFSELAAVDNHTKRSYCTIDDRIVNRHFLIVVLFSDSLVTHFLPFILAASINAFVVYRLSNMKNFFDSRFFTDSKLQKPASVNNSLALKSVASFKKSTPESNTSPVSTWRSYSSCITRDYSVITTDNNNLKSCCETAESIAILKHKDSSKQKRLMKIMSFVSLAKRQRRQKWFIRKICLITFCSFILNLPNQVIKLYLIFSSGFSDSAADTRLILLTIESIGYSLLYTNSAIEPFYYYFAIK